MKNLSSITPKELLTSWWTVQWVRVLVLMLIPIGVVDTAYTIEMTRIFGFEVEFNPITRELLAAGYWFPWSLLNILGFTFFCMMAGSYYLHTRWRPSGPDTFVFSFIIALRTAMVGYNVTFYYIPWIGGMVYPPFWAGTFTFILSLYLMNKLLKRQHDITWSQAKYSLTSRLVNYRDAKLITAAGIRTEGPSSTKVSNREAKYDVVTGSPQMKRAWWKGALLKRALYLGGSLFSFVLMGFSLQLISEITGLSQWSEAHGPFFVLNEITGPPVMASFLAIIGFISLSLLFIFKAFSTVDEVEFCE